MKGKLRCFARHEEIQKEYPPISEVEESGVFTIKDNIIVSPTGKRFYLNWEDNRYDLDYAGIAEGKVEGEKIRGRTIIKWGDVYRLGFIGLFFEME